MTKWFSLLSEEETKIFKNLASPAKIQDYLDQLRINFEEDGDTCSSPRVVIKRKSAHCIEAALLAAAVMIFHGKKPLLLDLKANKRDFDHVVCLFKKGKYWGAFSKSNHVSLRFREPVYRTTRELAMSYFHEYFNENGEKTLQSYSRPMSLSGYEPDWVIAEENLWGIANDLDEIAHFNVVPGKIKLRTADKFEMKAGNMVEYTLPKKKIQKSGKI